MPKKNKATSRTKGSKSQNPTHKGGKVQASLGQSAMMPVAFGQKIAGNEYHFGVASDPQAGVGLKLKFRCKYGYLYYNSTTAIMGPVPYNGGAPTTPDPSIRLKPNGTNWPVGLKYFAGAFDQFLIKRLRMYLIPQTSTSSVGTVTVGFVRDANRLRTLEGLSNTSKNAALAEVPGASTTSVWMGANIDIPTDDVVRYLGEGTTTVAANILLGEAGGILFAGGNIPGTSTVYHDIYLEGELDLFGFNPYFIGTTVDEKEEKFPRAPCSSPEDPASELQSFEVLPSQQVSRPMALAPADRADLSSSSTPYKLVLKR